MSRMVTTFILTLYYKVMAAANKGLQPAAASVMMSAAKRR